MIEGISSTHEHMRKIWSYANEFFQSYAREILARTGVHISTPPTVPVSDTLEEDILVVGVPYDPEKGFRDRDELIIGYSIGLFRRWGLEPERVRLVPRDLSYGGDFLDPSQHISADKVIVCEVPDPLKIAAEHARRMQTLKVDVPKNLEQLIYDTAMAKGRVPGLACEKDHPGLAISRFHTQTAWREAAERTGARVIITANQFYEIDHTNFDLQGFSYSAKQEFRARGDYGWQIYHLEAVVRNDLVPYTKSQPAMAMVS